MATTLGTPVNFGFTGTNGITIPGISGTLLQSADLTNQADVEEVRDADGDVVSRSFYNQNNDASLEYVVTGTTLADSITNTALQTPGTIIVITACTSMPELIATNWVVEPGVKVTGIHTSFKRITLSLKKYAAVTAIAS